MHEGYFSFVNEATLLPGFRPHFAEIDGVRTRYFLGGEGPPLTMVHGLGGAAVNFTKLAPILARRRRVLIPDLPGHGLSEPFRARRGNRDVLAPRPQGRRARGNAARRRSRLLHGRRRRAPARRRGARGRDRARAGRAGGHRLDDAPRGDLARRHRSASPRAGDDALPGHLRAPAAASLAAVRPLGGGRSRVARSRRGHRLPRRPFAAHRRRQRGPRPARRRPPSRPRPRPLPSTPRLGLARPARAARRRLRVRAAAACADPCPPRGRAPRWSASSPSRARLFSKGF